MIVKFRLKPLHAPLDIHTLPENHNPSSDIKFLCSYREEAKTCPPVPLQNTLTPGKRFSTPPPPAPSRLEHPSALVARPKPTKLTGVPYAFRCARENADGQVGPWSADLRRVVPCSMGKCADSNGDRDGNNGGIDGHGGAPHGLSPPPPEPRTLTSSPRRQHRFDLLVPALVEAFAELIDAGDSRIARATPVNTRLAQQPPSPLPPAAPVKNNRLSASIALAVKSSDATGTSHRHQQPTSSEGQGETNGMVWDEHWDSQRRTPFFRLRGQNLSVWQIPAL